MSVLVPVVNAGNMYCDNFFAERISSSTYSYSSGATRDSTNQNDIISNETVILDTALSGEINGLDTGEIENETIYYVYAVGDSSKFNKTGVIMSLNNSSPVLPSGYDMYRFIDYQITNSSGGLLNTYKLGSGKFRQSRYYGEISVLTNGTSTTFASVDLGLTVPPPITTISRNVLLNVNWTPSVAGDICTLVATGSSASSNIVISGTAAAKTQSLQVSMACGLNSDVASISYKVAASGSLSLSVTGYDYYL